MNGNRLKRRAAQPYLVLQNPVLQTSHLQAAEHTGWPLRPAHTPAASKKTAQPKPCRFRLQNLLRWLCASVSVPGCARRHQVQRLGKREQQGRAGLQCGLRVIDEQVDCDGAGADHCARQRANRAP